MSEPWKKVVFASECTDEGDCAHCGEEYSECECIGPTQDDCEYKWVNGVMWGRVK